MLGLSLKSFSHKHASLPSRNKFLTSFKPNTLSPSFQRLTSYGTPTIFHFKKYSLEPNKTQTNETKPPFAKFVPKLNTTSDYSKAMNKKVERSEWSEVA